MKNLKNALFVATMVAGFSLVYSVRAQSKPAGEDGVAGSPRARQVLNEGRASTPLKAPAPLVTTACRTPGVKGIAASPRVRQILAERKGIPSKAPLEVASSGTASPKPIAASPRVRQQLHQHGAELMIAPVK